MDYLLQNLTNVSSKEVIKEEEKIKSYFWDMTDQPKLYFIMIEELQMISLAVQISRTNEQLVMYGLDVIQRTGDFEKGPIEWYERDIAKGDSGASKHYFKIQNSSLLHNGTQKTQKDQQ